uniref:Jacalin-type lectin domain-containing protein n=2 Tax=Anolis carolinensis TaxID=28377 RepID=R4GBR3_ANOCA|nr:PREDICTED: zymogen granule membrane protein 16 [Anolis carolinensis]|eukprot:XP_003228266.3 PREDICTED: zymogen granule membrane protein 16 [Anolis carolinensis]
MQNQTRGILSTAQATKMSGFTLLTLLFVGSTITSAFLLPLSDSSYSGEFGGSGGKRFSHAGNQMEGPITALRVRANQYYIVGLQFRYCRQWSDYVGGTDGEMEEIFLYDDEDIIQITGRYDSYIQNLVFITNQRRSFVFGAYNGYSYYGYRGFTFNAVPLYRSAVLRYISGRSASYIDALSFHWGKPHKKSKKCRSHTVYQKK